MHDPHHCDSPPDDPGVIDGLPKIRAFVRDYGRMPAASDIQSLDELQAALVASVLRDVAALRS